MFPISGWPEDYAIGLATKFKILNYLYRRHDEDLIAIHSELAEVLNLESYFAEVGEPAKGYNLKADLPERTIAHVECFISQAFATWELALAFAVQLSRSVLRHRTTKRDIESALRELGDAGE